MHTDSDMQIDNEKSESVQRLEFLLTLIAKIMIDRDLQCKKATKEKIDRGECVGATSNQTNQV